MGSDDPEHGPAAEWDQAAIADQLAASSQPAERRQVVRKRRQQVTSDWDENSEESVSTSSDEVLNELEKALWAERAGGNDHAKHRRRRTSHRRGSRISAGWVNLAIGVFAVLAIAAAVAAIRGTRTPDPAPGPVARFNVPAQPTADHDSPAPVSREVVDPLEGLEVLEADDPELEAVRSAITGLLTEPTTEGKAQFLRETPDVHEHLAAMADHPVLTLGLEPTFGKRFIRSGKFIYAEILEAGTGVRGVTLEESDSGFLIDFDSLVGYSDADWEAIKSGEFDAPVTTRALARILPQAKAPALGQSVFEIQDPSRTETGTALLEMLEIDDSRLRTILESGIALPYILEFSPDRVDGRPVTRITRVVTTGWFDEAIFPWSSGWRR